MVACSVIPTAQEGEDFYKLEASVVFIVSSRAAQGNPIKEEEEEEGGGRGRETETGEREKKNPQQQNSICQTSLLDYYNDKS